jgi:hypothetical protein
MRFLLGVIELLNLKFSFQNREPARGVGVRRTNLKSLGSKTPADYREGERALKPLTGDGQSRGLWAQIFYCLAFPLR